MEQTTPWYVIQVAPHKESRVCELVQKLAPEGTIEEVFSPVYETEAKVHGEYQLVQRTFMPGYVLAATRDVATLVDITKKMEESARVLRTCEAYMPLEPEEQAWVAALTSKGNRIVPMSKGVIEGDRVLVLEGPLVGKEAQICKVDRHKSIAYVEFKMCNRTVKTKVGLGILYKRQAK